MGREKNVKRSVYLGFVVNTWLLDFFEGGAEIAAHI